VKETKVGGVEFDSELGGNHDPYIIALFGDENCGKTRFPLTGPEVIAYVPLEMKSYATVEKDAEELGKKVFKPKNPSDLLVPKRRVDAMKDDIERQKFYAQHIAKVKDVVYTMLEHDDVRAVVVDKFTTFCVWQEYAINGMTPKYVKIEGKVMQSKSEVRQSIIDFVNSLSAYGKTVVLNCAAKGDYDVVDAQGSPLRNTWDCGAFYMLGSHANLVCELKDNVYWDPKKTGDKYAWHYALSVRRCQRNPGLEGPEGNPLLRDEEITLPGLIQAVEQDKFDIERWL
jgi:hypothetical protein